MKPSKDRRAAIPAAARLQAGLPAALDLEVGAALARWDEKRGSARLWQRDSTLWTEADEDRWLGWLDLPGGRLEARARLEALAAETAAAGHRHLLLLGMGGSSLCPEVLAHAYGRVEGFPELLVLDSTDPAQIRAVETRIDPGRTLFVVSSKSGGTLETKLLHAHFFEAAKRALGAAGAARRFVAITDPGSALAREARVEGFARVLPGIPSVGGRFSALSDFGMAPAAAIGLETAAILERADEMARACGPGVSAAENPGVFLGTVLGVAARAGRDKVTLVASPAIRGLGAWLEQLLAESTGKEGKGLIPVDGEPLGAAAAYGDDRLFVALTVAGDEGAAAEPALAAIEKAGHPVVRIELRDLHDLGAEFFRWEIATAVAASLLRVHPFVQPDVEASKAAALALTAAAEATGALPAETPILEGKGIRVFADERNAGELAKAAGGKRTVGAFLRAHFGRVRAGDYAAFLAFLERSAATEAPLEAIRLAVRDAKAVATCVGFGPRYLHSTGQLHKTGPNSGVFLMITGEDARDLPVPGRKLSFGAVKAAQARGDFAVLAERGRRALRVHLGPDAPAGIETLARLVRESLS